MNKLLSLYNKLSDLGIRFYTWDLDSYKAATIEIDNKYGIFVDLSNIQTSAEEIVVIAHEGGHAVTGSTHKLYSPYELIEKHENTADKWAIEHTITEDELDDAIAEGCGEYWQLAERFGVTEDFVKKTVCWYTYGNLAVEKYL